MFIMISFNSMAGFSNEKVMWFSLLGLTLFPHFLNQIESQLPIQRRKMSELAKIGCLELLCFGSLATILVLNLKVYPSLINTKRQFLS